MKPGNWSNNKNRKLRRKKGEGNKTKKIKNMIETLDLKMTLKKDKVRLRREMYQKTVQQLDNHQIVEEHNTHKSIQDNK